MAGTVASYLEQLLNLHWLRPETALWRTFDCMLVQKHAQLDQHAIDLGCGDGSMSYIMAGGRIEGYDVFQDTTELTQYNQGSDIYNVASALKPALNHADLRHRFAWGVDHKEGLIAKAERYDGFYQKTLVHDLNRELPFAEKSFTSGFSNILYWLDDPATVLKDWHRILCPNAQLVLLVPNQHFRQKAPLYYLAPHQGQDEHLNFFDRGYGPLIKQCHDGAFWQKTFEDCGFNVKLHKNYLSDPVMQLWNIGTRPIAPLLISMTNDLSPENRLKAREQWVEFFSNFLTPLIERELAREASEDECAFHFYLLERN